MAVVHRVRDTRHGRDVAVKVMLPTVAASVGAKRCLREIEPAARPQHPHIVPVFDSGSAEGQLYFVMPLIEGESLRALLERRARLGIEDAVPIAGEAADALEYAHGDGVIHRDLKPENILRSRGHALLTYAGRYDEALPLAERPIEFDPQFPDGWHIAGYIELSRGAFDRARSRLERAIELSHRASWPVAKCGCALVGLGRVDEARALLAELEQRAVSDPNALALRVENLWDAARHDPRYQGLLQRVGLAD